MNKNIEPIEHERYEEQGEDEDVDKKKNDNADHMKLQNPKTPQKRNCLQYFGLNYVLSGFRSFQVLSVGAFALSAST